MEAESQIQSETVSQPLKDHCDYLMDSIDAQLSQLQVSILSGQGRPVTNRLTENNTFRNTTKRSGKADGECEDQKEIFWSPAGAQDVTAGFDLSPDFRRSQPNIPLIKHGRQEAEAGSESRKKQYEWRVQQLLGPQQLEIQGDQSDTNTVDSICTEDFAFRFHEGMVDPALNFDMEPDSEGSFISNASFSEQSEESAGLYLESNSQQGNLGREVCGRPLGRRLFRGKECNGECTQHDRTSRQNRSGTLPKTSARIQAAQGLPRAENDEFLGCASPQGDVTDGPVNSTAQRLDIVQQFREDLEHVLQRTRSQAVTLWTEQASSRSLTSRTQSVESLGGRISKLSQINMSEQSLQRRDVPSRNRNLVANPARKSPVNSNPLKGKGLVTSCSPAPNPAVITQEGLGTNFDCIEIKMKGTLKSQSQSRERLSTDLNPGPQVLSTGDIGNLLPIQQESSAPSHHLLPAKSGENQQHSVMVNRTLSPCHVASALAPRCTLHACSLPAHSAGNAKYLDKTNIPGQRNRMTDAVTGFESQPLTAKSCRSSPVCLSGFDPPPVCSLRKGSSCSKLAPDHRSDIALDPKRRMQSPDLPQSKLTSSTHITKAKWTHARSNTHGGYREELGSHGLGSIRAKSFPHRTGEQIQIDRDVSGSCAVKKCCSSTKEPSRDTVSKKTIMGEEDFEQFFMEPDSERRTSSPSKWDPSLKEWAGHTWNWNKPLEMSSSYRRPLISRRPRRCQLVDVIRTEETQIERSTAKLQQGLSVEEEKLIERKPQLREADLTPSKVLQQSKYAMQDVHSPKETVEKGQQDATALESRQQGPQNEAEKASKELVVPEFKRDGCLQDLRDLEGERELLKPHSAMIQSNAQGRMQNEIATLILERDDLRACLRQLESSLSFLERQELERELKSMKNEFFTEQQSTRIRIKQLQQQLEESEARLEQRTAEVTQLLERNSNLESQVRELEKSLQAERAAPNSNNSNHVHELSSQLTERDLKVSALEKILSEKELEQLRLRETVVVLRAEKKAQLSAMETLRKEHERQLTVTAVEKHWEQAKHEETLTLREQAWAQEKSMKKLNEELKQEAKELVQNALAQDHRRCEEDREGQLQQQCLSLEEENGRALKQANEDLEKEKRNSLALQNKIVELQKRIEELEFQCRSLQREKDQAVSNVRTLLTEENQKEIKQLREEMQLEKKHEVERLTSKMDLMEGELLILRAENNEASLKEREARMQGERVERSFISEIKMECERIQVLIQSTQVRALGRAVSPSRSKLGSLTQMSLGQAIHTLRRAGEDLRQLVMDLHQELESQRFAVHHLQRDKGREVKQQQEQLLLVKGEALAALKDRLFQDHNEELSKLQRPQLKDSRGREEHKLQQHLQEKDKELQVVQTDMAKWKDGPACKHTCKFQEKLNTELEKRLYKHGSEHQRKVEMLENEIHPLPLEHSETSHLRSAFTPSMASSAVVSLRQKDFGTLKLLRHLQSRVKQLRAENITYHGANPKDPGILHVTAGSSYREMPSGTRKIIVLRGKGKQKVTFVNLSRRCWPHLPQMDTAEQAIAERDLSACFRVHTYFQYTLANMPELLNELERSHAVGNWTVVHIDDVMG